ncbi:MAG: PQQ-dependent sugar dehydrogenase, partial [Erysipelothrix sp.]|nr:PQQ-dependent sugar dehydrogenase [Erysipelothrix sp.]
MKVLYGILLVLFLVGCSYQTPVNNNDNNNIDDNNVVDNDMDDNNTVDDNVNEIKVTIIRNDLVSPWGIDELPDGSLLITQRKGQLLRLDGEQLIEIEADFSMVQVAGQGGLLDVLVDRDFEDTGYVLFTIAQNTGNTALLRARLTEDNQLEDLEIIYRTLPEFASDNHFGSRVVMDTEGNLFMSTGDRQVTSNRYRAQQLDNGHGKVLHMTKDGEPVQGS